MHDEKSKWLEKSLKNVMNEDNGLSINPKQLMGFISIGCRISP
jgi:hypothetical protein